MVEDRQLARDALRGLEDKDLRVAALAMLYDRSHGAGLQQLVLDLYGTNDLADAVRVFVSEHRAVRGGRADLLSRDAKRKVLRCIFLVLSEGKCVGGGFFYAPGKAVTADHNLLPSQEVGSWIEICTTTKTIPVQIRRRSTKYDYALLECGDAVQEEHLAMTRFEGDAALSTDPAEFLTGTALTLCAYQIGLHKDLPEFGEGTSIDMGLLPAWGCKVSKHKHHLLYDVRSVSGNSGCALVLYDGEVVGMHLAVVNTLMDDLDRAKELDAQMDEVAESIASFAAGTAQLGVALLCHVFTSELDM